MTSREDQKSWRLEPWNLARFMTGSNRGLNSWWSSIPRGPYYFTIFSLWIYGTLHLVGSWATHLKKIRSSNLTISPGKVRMVKVGCFLVGTTSKTWRHEDLETPQSRFLGPTSQCHGKTPASRFWGVFYRDNMMGLFFCLLIGLAIISWGKPWHLGKRGIP